MILEVYGYKDNDYEKYIEPLIKNNMETLFIQNFGGFFIPNS